MPRTITQRELRNQSAAIIDAVSEGESFIVTRNDVPVADLRPISRMPKRVVTNGEVIAAFVNAPSLDARLFRADLDGRVDQGVG